MKEQILKWQDKLQNTDGLFYGELEYYLDDYIKKFFEVSVDEVGFDEKHKMNDLQFWLVVSMLVKMDMLEYGTSPRGAWLTDDGKEFKKYCIENESPISTILRTQE